jgi:predicted aspartyl protease
MSGSALEQPAGLGHPLDMGKVIVKIKLTNQGDLVALQRKFSKAQPRSVEAEALVDTGATRLYLKPSVIRALGLEKVDEIISQTTNGPKKRSVYEPVRLEIQGRYGNFDVVDIGEKVPNLVGQVPLEYLDFVVDPKRRKLVSNPDHGGMQMSEEY